MDEGRPNQPGEQQPPASEPTITAVSATEEPSRRLSGMAIIALILSLLSPPLGLILGIIALVQISREPNGLRGHALAVAATTLGGFLTLILLFSVFVVVLHRPSAETRKIWCMNNVKQVMTAIHMYSQDNDFQFPDPENWNDLLKPYIKDAGILVCPAESSKDGTPTYGMNALLAGLREDDVQVPEEVVMFFDSVPGRNQAGGPELLPQPPRHDDEHVFGFADGHVRAVAELEPAELNWDPSSVRPAETIPPPVEP